MAGKVTDSDLPFETARLKLRRFEEDDADSLLALYGNPEVVRYLYTEPMQRDGLGKALERRLRPTTLDTEGDVLDLAAELRSNGEFVGAMTFFYRSSEHRRGEIGYVVARSSGVTASRKKARRHCCGSDSSFLGFSVLRASATPATSPQPA